MPAFEPVAWNPPTAPGLVDAFEENDRLRTAERWETGGIGPEDVAVDTGGAIYTGLADGTILRFGGGDGVGGPERIASVGGRPLGVEILGDGELLVCNGLQFANRVALDGDEESVFVAETGRCSVSTATVG